MTSPASSPAHSGLRAAGILLTVLAVGGTVYMLARLDGQVQALESRVKTLDDTAQQVLAEVTRMRIEQSVGMQGPQALLTRLRTYAPLLTSARTTEPDFEMAKKEMDAVMRAFSSLGNDAWPAVMARLGEIKGDVNFDEARWLIEAAARIDPKASKELLKEILLGRKLPSPRLRWQAARLLIDLDKPLAQTLLRQVLMTESSRGANPERMAAYGPMPDQAAFATTGFNNFVLWYLRSEDPKADDTLLMLLGRTEHDRITIQECVEALGNRRVERAVEPIRKLYENPPLQQQDPIFLVKCLDAIYAIQGPAARPFLEKALETTQVESVATHIRRLLGQEGAARQTPNSIAPPGRK